MKIAARPGITEFTVTVIAVFAVIFLTERSAWRQINRLRAELSSTPFQQVRSADRVRAALLEFTRAEARVGQETNHLPALLGAGSNLQTVLRQELASAGPSEKGKLLQRLANDFTALVELRSGSGPAAADNPALRLQQAMDHCEQLRALDQAEVEQLLETNRQGLLRLQRFLFLAILGLLVCGAVVLVFTYRRMVAPLHSSLAESRTLMERQEKLASLGIFATGIAHEIRNPITAMKVRLFTLKDSHPPGSSEFEDLQVIESEVSRLERIVQQFLRFARPAEPDLVIMEIDVLLREVHSLLLPELTKRGIQFGLDLKAGVMARIDPEKMKQVLMNFIQNGAESIEGEGRVTVSSRTAERTIAGRSLPAVVVDIADTGKGMPPEVQKRLFDPFFTTKEHGTGLGLPIAARIVEKHGGLIQYQTEPGRGTTFTVLLPIASA